MSTVGPLDVGDLLFPVPEGHFRCACCKKDFPCVGQKHNPNLPNGGMLPLVKARFVPGTKIPVADNFCSLACANAQD